MTVWFVSHPEVVVDPRVPITEWGLSDQGRARLPRLLAEPWVPGVTRIRCSAERKATETADALASLLGRDVGIDPELGENDRSATGYLPPAEFEQVADEFFARAGESVRGWETALDAQARIVAATRRASDGAGGDVAIVAHGGVGTLLLCALMGVPIDRRYDQPGQGSYFSFEAGTGEVLHPWRRIGGD